MKKLFIIAFTILTLFQIGRSQCPPDNGCGDWSVESMLVISGAPHCSINFHYRTRVCNGVNQVVIDSYAAEGSCESLRTLSRDGKTLNSLTEFATLVLVENLARDNVIPSCNSGNTQDEIQFYTANCGA